MPALMKAFWTDGETFKAVFRTIQGRSGPVELSPPLEVEYHPVGISRYAEYLDGVNAIVGKSGDDSDAGAKMLDVQRKFLAEQIVKWNGPIPPTADGLASLNPLVHAKLFAVVVGNDCPDDWAE